MTVIHTSDWHLGAKLHDQDRADEHRQFLTALSALVKAESADAIVISGDVFDMRQPGPAAQSLYYDFLASLDACKTCRKVVVTAGNHDSASLLAASGPVLKRLGVEVIAKANEDVSKELIALKKADGTNALVIAAVPFMNDGELTNFARAAGVAASDAATRIAAGFKAHYQSVLAAAQTAAQGAPILVMGHCAIAGATVSDSRSERARVVGGLDAFDGGVFAGADYVALGHYHIPQSIGDSGRVFYSGSPLQMSFSEAGQQKFVNVIRFGEKAGDAIDVKQIPLAVPVPLARIEGSVETVRANLLALVQKGVRTYVNVRVTEGEGELAEFWNQIDAIVDGKDVRVLQKENARPQVKPGAGLVAASEKDLKALTPEEVAVLRIGEEDLTPEEKAEYIKMVKDVMNKEVA